MEKNSIEIRIIDEVSKDNISKIAEDISEIALDAVLEDGILKDIPIIGSLSGITKTILNIREKILAKKILNFLFTLKNIPLSKRQEFVEKIEKNKQKIGETVIMLLDKIDDFEKTKIIGNLFKSYLLEKISYSDFTKISRIISRIDIKDLDFFVSYHKSHGILFPRRGILESFTFSGLMSMRLITPTNPEHIIGIPIRLSYRINSLGKKLIKFGF